jgi:hypothetical protein
MMGAIAALHSAEVALFVSPTGTGSLHCVKVAILASFTQLPGSALVGDVGVNACWPDTHGRSFWGLAYDLCYKLDKEISKVYKNEKLWE